MKTNIKTILKETGDLRGLLTYVQHPLMPRLEAHAVRATEICLTAAQGDMIPWHILESYPYRPNSALWKASDDKLNAIYNRTKEMLIAKGYQVEKII